MPSDDDNRAMNTNLSRLPLRGLRMFCVAARHESFRAAADEMFVTASAISHQIKSLEEGLGVSLFDRNSRALSLTDVGRSLFEDTEPLLRQLDNTLQKHRAGATRRSLRVSVQPFFASELFVPRLSEFSERHPDLDLHVETSDESSERIPANADVSIRLFRSPPPGTSADLLFPLQLVPAGSPDFAAKLKVRKKRIVSPFPIIVHDTRPRAWQQWTLKTGIELPADTKTIRLDSMIAVARAAQQGMGAALIPTHLSKEWFASGSLVSLFDKALVVDGGYYLISKDEHSRKETVRVFREWVLDTFDSQTDRHAA